jgi:predicted nucleotidyltransferase
LCALPSDALFQVKDGLVLEDRLCSFISYRYVPKEACEEPIDSRYSHKDTKKKNIQLLVESLTLRKDFATRIMAWIVPVEACSSKEERLIAFAPIVS